MKLFKKIFNNLFKDLFPLPVFALANGPQENFEDENLNIMAFFPAIALGLTAAASALSIGLQTKQLFEKDDEEEEEETPYDPTGGVLKSSSTNGSQGEVRSEKNEQFEANSDQGHSLGRPIALEQDPVLNQEPQNLNNFIF